MEWICLCLAVLLLFALIVQFETENQVFRGALLPALYFESLHSILMVNIILIKLNQSNFKNFYMLFYFQIIVKFGQKIYEFSRELALGAIFLSLVYYGDGQRKIKQMSLIAWSLLYVLLWSNLTGIQILICGACAILNHQAIQNKKIYLCKKSLPKKFSFQPEKCNFFGDEVLSNYEIQSPKFCTSKKESNYSSPVHVGKVAENKKIENVNNKLSPLSGSTKEVKKKIKKKENEIESLSNEEFKSEPAPSIKATNINSSVFSKSFLASLESDKTNREDSSTLDDFYSHLSSLNLGKKQKKSKKPSNFLFESHNFAEKKYSSSIIKPAKFIKNLSSSWTCTESNDSISRSSTPSSGYSSQKQEPIRFEFNKTMSPISVSPLPRRDFCDYFEGNNRLYNFNCYPNEFVMPFQQCQGPMGHTTVYTCTRPPSLPFPFSPQGFSSYRFPSSPRSSDVSESENLFQNTSRNFEKSQKWYKLKNFFYYFSIFLNCLTLFSFAYFFSAGMITIDWNVPKINIFM